jgi:hypothetical protein
LDERGRQTGSSREQDGMTKDREAIEEVWRVLLSLSGKEDVQGTRMEDAARSEE